MTLRARLAAGETVVGCFTRYPSPGLVEVLGYLGFDFVVFDGEHGSISVADCEDLTRAAEVVGATAGVRVAGNVQHEILRYLDCGPRICHVPNVSTAADAEAAVAAVKYQPLGRRGLAGVRAAQYGRRGSLADYVQRANEETVVVLHVETAQAVDEIEAIAAVAGVDVLFIGPTDLSNAFGVPGQPGEPRVAAAIDRLVAAIAASGKALGTMATTPESARAWRERGARYVVTGVEALLADGAGRWLGA